MKPFSTIMLWKPFTLLLIASSISFVAQGQAEMPRFEKGTITPGSLKMKSEVRQLLGVIGDKLYLASTPVNGFTYNKRSVHKVDKRTLKQDLKEDIKIKHDGEPLILTRFAVFNDRLLVFGFQYRKKENAYFNYAHELDPETLEPKGNIIAIGKKDMTDEQPSGQYTRMAQTENDQYLVAYTRPVSPKKKESGSISLAVLDTDLQLLWEKTITLDIPNKFLELQKIDVDDEGTVYILVREKLEKGGDVKKKSVNLQYRLFKQHKQEPLQEITITTYHYLVTSARLLHYEDKLYIAGFYSDYDRQAEELKGLFLAEIPKDAEKVKTFKTKEIESGYLAYSYQLKDVIRMEDGSYIMTAEEEWEDYYYEVDDNGRNQEYTIYSRRNILVAKLGMNGEFEWTQIIKKDQEGGSRRYISYTPCSDPENLYLIFNSAEKNMTPEKTYDKGSPATFKLKKKSFIEIVSVNLQTGDYRRNVLVSPEESKLGMLPGMSSMMDDQCIIYEARWSKRRFTVLSF